MFKKSALPLLYLLYLLPSCSSSKKTTIPESEIKLSASYIPIVTIDGKDDEWSAVPHDFSAGSTVEMSVANNNSNLFILLKIPGYIEQNKILQGGMDVWLDYNNKKEKKSGISYPVKGELGEPDAQQFIPSQKQDLKQIHYKMAAQLISLQRFGFKDEFNGVQSIRQNTGFKAAISWDDNDVMIYELTIPINAIPQELKKDNLGIGFNIHGVDRPKNNSSQNTSYSGGGRGSGMGGRGGHRGEGNFGNRRTANNGTPSEYKQREKLYAPETFWVLYTLGHE